MLNIYHDNDGVPGYRQMADYLNNMSISISSTTSHKYMHELGLFSVVRPKYQYKPAGQESIIFPNLVKRDFKTYAKNKVWLIDFTYMFTTKGEKVYNCTIIDLYDRSAVATYSSQRIDSKLAIKTLQIALSKNKIKKYVVLHSD